MEIRRKYTRFDSDDEKDEKDEILLAINYSREEDEFVD
jgi:hypothetical protein